MSTQLTYRQAVQDLGYDALSTAIIDRAIQQARRRVLTARRWSFSELSSSALTTVANVATVSLASVTDLAYLDAVRLTDGTRPLNVAYRPYNIIRDLQDRCTATGRPDFWTRRGGSIVFYPTPSRVLTVTVEYIATPADLAVSPAVDIIPDAHQDLVVWAAVVPLAFRQRGLAESSAADQYFTKVLLPQHAGQDRVEQRQTSEQVRTGYWGS